MKLDLAHNAIVFFFYKGLRFLLLLVALDFGLGYMLNQLYFKQESGKPRYSENKKRSAE